MGSWIATHIIIFGFFCLTSVRVAGQDKVSFAEHIAPILIDRCLACHTAKKAEGGYRLDSYVQLSKAGDSGVTVLGNGTDEPSELLRRIKSVDDSERMPAESDPLSHEQKVRIETWLRQGATFDGQRKTDAITLVAPPRTYPPPPSSYAFAIPITALAFDATGEKLWVNGYGEVTEWAWQQRELKQRVGNMGPRIYRIQYLPEQKALAVGCGEPGIRGELRIFDAEQGTLRKVVARANDVVLDFAFRPGSRQSAVASADHLVRIVDMDSGETIKTLAAHSDYVNAVAFSDDGKLLASASRDRSVKIYEADQGELMTTYMGHSTPARGVVFLPDGKEILSSSAKSPLHRWSIEGAKKKAEISGAADSYRILRSNDNVFIAASDGQMRQYRISDNGLQRSYVGPNHAILSLAIHPSENYMAVGYEHGEVWIWNLQTGEKVQNWPAFPSTLSKN
jgi:WD40 repeat protein